MTLYVSAKHRFGDFQLDVTFEAPGTGITALFGPSGSGKSTVLAIVAGLLRPDECRVGVNGSVLADTGQDLWVAPERRHVGLVFQESRLFPHMSVADNLRYGLRRRQAHAFGFDAVIDLLGIGHLLARRPHSLSGGEKQRVAIGRALLAQPQLLLLDEPLAALDAARKADILPYLARLPAALGVPMLLITHDFDEVARLADTLVLIEAGRVAASGRLAELAARADLPLVRRDDAGAVLACRVAGYDADSGLSVLDSGGVRLLVPRVDAVLGAALRVRIPAREVILAHGDTRGLEEAVSLHNILPGTVRAVVADPERRAANVSIALSGAPTGDPAGPALLARVTPDAVRKLELAPDLPVLALIKSMSIEVLPPLTPAR